jgi:hypothetical protein
MTGPGIGPLTHAGDRLERALRAFGGDELCREDASALLRLWKHVPYLRFRDRQFTLDRFPSRRRRRP